MRSLRDFDDALLDSAELIKKAGKSIIYNMGKIIATFVFLVMLAVTFTEVSFLGLFTESFASSLLLLTITQRIKAALHHRPQENQDTVYSSTAGSCIFIK